MSTTPYVWTRKERGAHLYYDQYDQRWISAFGTNVTQYINNCEVWDKNSWNRIVWDKVHGQESVQADPIITAMFADAPDPYINVNNTAGGEVEITTSNADDDFIQLQLKGEAFSVETTYPVYFGIRCKLSEATQMEFMAGLCKTCEDVFTELTDGVYFEKVDGTTDTDFVTEQDITETTSASALATMDTSYHVYELHCDGAGNVTPYVDGTEYTVHTANVPTDEPLTQTIAIKNGSGQSRTLTVDWIRAVQVR
jgi:hypothetical protein